MSSLKTIEADEVLTVRVYKRVPFQETAWANTYEVLSLSSISDTAQVESALDQLKDIFVALEKGILDYHYIVDRVVISTYVPDGNPYDPYTFTVYTVSQYGEYITQDNQVMPLQFCTLVKRRVSFGRQGNLLYRGVVGTHNATITGGGTIISSIRISQITAALESFMNSLQSAGWRLVMASGKPQVDVNTLRIVNDLEVKKEMRFKKLNNRYFDKEREQN
jgi:hypothetical protein